MIRKCVFGLFVLCLFSMQAYGQRVVEEFSKKQKSFSEPMVVLMDKKQLQEMKTEDMTEDNLKKYKEFYSKLDYMDFLCNIDFERFSQNLTQMVVDMMPTGADSTMIGLLDDVNDEQEEADVENENSYTHLSKGDYNELYKQLKKFKPVAKSKYKEDGVIAAYIKGNKKKVKQIVFLISLPDIFILTDLKGECSYEEAANLFLESSLLCSEESMREIVNTIRGSIR